MIVTPDIIALLVIFVIGTIAMTWAVRTATPFDETDDSEDVAHGAGPGSPKRR